MPVCEQEEPQEMEPPVTVPVPVPALDTVRVKEPEPAEVVKVLSEPVARLDDASFDLTR